jgi:hypothetical protein
MEAVTAGSTVIVAVAVLEHPAAVCPVTVYVVTAAGVAITLIPLVALRPEAGAQV